MIRHDAPLRPDLLAICRYVGRPQPDKRRMCAVESPLKGALAELATLRRPATTREIAPHATPLPPSE